MISLKITSKSEIAQDTHLFELVQAEGGALPGFTAGAHILVTAPNGVSRRYSLCNAPGETHRYQIAVKREAAGRGGSISMIDEAKPGDTIKAEAPENFFELSARAKSHLLIAGGIGITPILAMGRQLAAEGRDFRLVYCSRSPETTAFLDVLAGPEFAGRVLVHHDHGERDRSIDLADLLAEFADDTHVYCCGPRGLMTGVQEATRHWPFSTVHFEDFGSNPAEAAPGEGPFLIELAKRGITLEVPPELSILEVLRKNDIRVPSSCESGTCGACRTRLLDGEAVHYDYVLDEDEHADNIMICVSRAKSKVLKLNI